MEILILDTTSKIVTASLGEGEASTALDYTVSYGDATSSAMTEGVSTSASNSTNRVTICSSPASSTRRLIRNITINNRDTIAHNIILEIYNGTTHYVVTKRYVLPGQSWTFGQINNSAHRAIGADIDAGTNDSLYVTPKAISDSYKLGATSGGWTSETDTWSYSSVDSPTGVISINADVTQRYTKGMRVSYEQSQALSAYWTFNTNSTADVGSFTMGNVGTPTYTSGKFSNALTLNGTNQALSITDTATLKPTGDFTIGAWFKTSNTGAYKILFQSYSDNTNSNGISLQITDGNVLACVIGNNGASASTFIIGKTVVTDGNWHYVVWTHRNNYGQVYLDGVLEAGSYSVTPTYAATNYIRIGCANETGVDTAWWNGQIDDLFVINGYALDEKTIYDKYVTVTAQGTGNITVSKKGIITGVGVYSGGNTLITVYHGTDFMLANSTISSPKYSNIKAPFGFDINPNKWTQMVEDLTDKSKTTTASNTWYGQTNVLDSSLLLPSISIPIGVWRILFSSVISSTVTGTTLNVYATIGTSQSTSTDDDFTASANNGGASGALYVMATVDREKTLSLLSKTTYYMLIKTTLSNAQLNVYSSISPTRIKAICAYL